MKMQTNYANCPECFLCPSAKFSLGLKDLESCWCSH
jgi:hypothetical protein